jgi:4-hydroxybenzoate polyprenyltransferase
MKKSRIKAFLELSRANLLVATIGHATLGLFLGAESIESLLYIGVMLFIMLHYSIAFLACNVNCLYDYEVDRRYKRYLSSSVDTLGKDTLKHIVVFEFFIALALIVCFLYLGHYVTSIAAIVAVFVAISYSAEPFRVKKRGLASPLPVMILYMLPLIGGWFIFKDFLDISFLIFLIGYALMNEGFTLVNVCEDYHEDQDVGIRTWSHIFGLKKTLTLAYVFALLGILCVIVLWYKLCIVFDGLKTIPAFVSLLFATVLILKAAFEVGQARLGKNLEMQAKTYGKKLQKWFIMTRYPLMAASFLLLL